MENDRKLTADFLESLTKASRKIRTAFNQQVTANGLTYPRARALLRLSRRECMTQSELALELELEQATLVRLLDRMEENGIIERRPDLSDRRVKQVALTAHGREQAAFVQAIGARLRERIFEGLDPEQLSTSINVLELLSERVADLEIFDVAP
ncbi:MarR family winged helix-turn-helix transcriptional regulator [Rhizobium sp. SGZ-381]|uniref:MarR family winged helix-turn-helix transcriptional regulator n=1 Tax=Rhizobium sp. SGZ-381 TaxID=3342800 RepID=UPI00366E637D